MRAKRKAWIEIAAAALVLLVGGLGDGAHAQAPATPPAAPKSAPAGAMDGPPRERPLGDFALMEFLDTAGHARQIDRACPAAFDTESKERIYLAWRWGRSVGATPAYPPQLLLTVIQGQSEHARALKGIDCAAKATKDLAASFAPFIAKVPEVVRLSEIR